MYDYGYATESVASATMGNAGLAGLFIGMKLSMPYGAQRGLAFFLHSGTGNFPSRRGTTMLTSG